MERPKKHIYSEQERRGVLEILEKRRSNGGFGTYKRHKLKEVHMSFCLTSRQYKKIKELAKKEQKNESEFIRYAIEFYCDLKEFDSKSNKGGEKVN